MRSILLTVLLCTALAGNSVALATTLKVAIYENPPLLQLGSGAAPTGLFVDVLQAVAKSEGWTLDWVPGTWPECLERLEAGTVDLLPAIAFTEDRSKKWIFTHETVLSNWGVVHARPGLPVQSFPELRNLRIAVPRSDIYESQIRRLLRGFGVPCTWVERESYADVLSAVARGEADAGVTSRFTHAKADELRRVRPTPLVFSPIELRMAMPRDRPDAIRQALDRHLAEMKGKRESTYHRSLAHWLGNETPPTPEWLLYSVSGLGVAFLALLVLTVFLGAKLRMKGNRPEWLDEDGPDALEGDEADTGEVHP